MDQINFRGFPKQGSHLGLPHCRQTLYRLSHQGGLPHCGFFVSWAARKAQDYWSGQPCPFSRVSSWPRNWTGVYCIVDGFFTNRAIRKALLVQFSRSVMSNSLRPHGSPHVRPPCLSPTPRVHPNSCPLSQWCPLEASILFLKYLLVCTMGFPFYEANSNSKYEKILMIVKSEGHTCGNLYSVSYKFVRNTRKYLQGKIKYYLMTRWPYHLLMNLFPSWTYLYFQSCNSRWVWVLSVNCAEEQVLLFFPKWAFSDLRVF